MSAGLSPLVPLFLELENIFLGSGSGLARDSPRVALGHFLQTDEAMRRVEQHSIQAVRVQALLGNSRDLVSRVKSTLTGVISSHKYSYLNYIPRY